MRITYIITSANVEKLKQKARKLKRSEGIPLHEALDRVAQTAGLNHWHHVIESAKNFEPTETAYRSGVIIAMDAKDAGDFYDDTGIFVVDNHAECSVEKICTLTSANPLTRTTTGVLPMIGCATNTRRKNLGR